VLPETCVQRIIAQALLESAAISIESRADSRDHHERDGRSHAARSCSGDAGTVAAIGPPFASSIARGVRPLGRRRYATLLRHSLQAALRRSESHLANPQRRKLRLARTPCRYNTMHTRRMQSGTRAKGSAADFAALDKDGFIVVQDALDSSWVTRLRRAFENAPATQDGTQHVALTNTTPEIDAWRDLEWHPILITVAEHVLGTPFHVRELHGRNPQPGFGQQGLHTDWMPRASVEPYFVLTTLWMLDDFTSVNGGTRVVPGSHRFTRPVPKSLAQPLARHGYQKTVIGRAGSVLVLNGHLWHSGQRNDSDGPRRAVQMNLGRGPLEAVT
jgi:Phytanoyl-CoA dioxygenase (PhyH)